MKLLIQGDDYGFTKGVTLGIIEAIDHGVLTCTGMFTNMEIAPWAAGFIKERPEFCFGIDFNLVSGPCCANPKDIPHLLDKNNCFIRSNIRIHDNRWRTLEGRAELFPYDETYLEMRAQYNRFVELTGKKPGYLNGHSIVSETMIQAMRTIAKEESLPVSFDFMKLAFGVHSILKGKGEKDEASMSKVFNPQNQLNKNPLEQFLKHKEELLQHEYVFAGGHPGYVDADLFDQTSLSLERCRDLEFVTSDLMKQFIKENEVELIDYYDITDLLIKN